jgi:hypothetical protein
MEPLARASLLWGVASGLLFAVLALGYRITTGVPVSVLVVLGVAVGVGAVTAGLSYLVEGRLR